MVKQQQLKDDDIITPEERSELLEKLAAEGVEKLTRLRVASEEAEWRARTPGQKAARVVEKYWFAVVLGLVAGLGAGLGGRR